MARLVISQNLSLDDVTQDPTGGEGFPRGGWFDRIEGVDRAAWAEATLDEALAAEALLFGRNTYDFFAARWPSRTGALADRLNSIPKYVVSSTLHAPAWSNSTVLGDDVPGAPVTLKRDVAGEIVVYGSRRLVSALIAHGLVDELRLTVFPVALGAGDRLFDGLGDELRLRLLRTRTLGHGLAHLSYEVVHPRYRVRHG